MSAVYEPDSNDAAAELVGALQAFADLADIRDDERAVEAVVAGSAGLPLAVGMTARTAVWLAEILRRETAAVGGFDVWGQ